VVSHVKGHEVYCVEEDQDAGKPYPIYRYKDDKTLVPEEGNAQRACKLCKKKPTADGHDPCLGHLPGVIAACCGHGADDGYLSFRNGIILRFAPAVVEKCETNATPKTGNDEFLGALAERLAARADTAEAAGDDEMAVQMRAASEAVHATEFLRMALSAMESAHYEWDKFKR
jgi:hypothetical protein